MRFVLILVFVFLSSIFAYTQEIPKVEILTSNQIVEVFNDSVKRQLGFRYPIFQVYRYKDNLGEYLCVLMESRDSFSVDRDTFNRSIEAINFRIDKGKYVRSWAIKDAIILAPNEEQSIWFWNNYMEFKDFDNDGIFEPIVVYGTSGINGYDDGRVKIIVFFKGKKYAIRHQNGVLDYERKTEIDSNFYSLPSRLKDSIKSKMHLMTKRDQAIFTKFL